MQYLQRFYACPACLGNYGSLSQFRAGKEQHELFPTVTCRRVSGTSGKSSNFFRHQSEAVVSRLVPIVVVEELEKIDIEEYEGDGRSALHRLIPQA
jgi:hypothetical protein